MRDAVQGHRSKLHQVGGLTCRSTDYPGWAKQLEGLPSNREAPELRSFCLDAMRAHASTRERLRLSRPFFHKP